MKRKLDMKMRTAITGLLIMLVGILPAQDHLQDYLETAAQNNPGLKAHFSEYMASLEKIPQVKTIPDPQIAFGYFLQPVETRYGPQKAVISFSQMFPWFGTTGSKEDVAVSKAKAAYEVFLDQKARLFFEVKAAYYEMYFINKGIDITKKNIRILESFRNLVLVKIEAGEASAVDELRLLMEQADLENYLAGLKDSYHVNRIRFNNLLNVDPESTVVLPDELKGRDLRFSRQEVLDSLENRNHVLLKLDFISDAYENEANSARKTGLPNISLGIDYFMIGKADNAMTDGGNNGRDAILFPKIGITVPLYRKKYGSMVKEALYMQDAAISRKEEKVNAIETLFEQTYFEYNDAMRRITLFRQQRDLAGKAISILETDYTTNGDDFEEILRMERKLLEYSLELERAHSDKQASIAFIYYLMGQ